MRKETKALSIVKLEENDYAIIVPGQVVFALDANPRELDELAKTISSDAKERDYQIQNAPTITNLTLLPTTDCNLRCIYCYSKGGETAVYMNKRLAQAAITAVSREFETKSIRLTFAGGGEPFMNFELMKAAHGYAQRLFQDVYLSVVTNGTFGPEQREWLVKNNVSTRISYDSVFQAKQRTFADGTSSQKVVEQNIRALQQLGHNSMVQCIITNHAVGKMVEALQHLADLDVKIVKMPPMQSSDISRGGRSMVPPTEEYAEEFLHMLDYIAERNLPIKVDTGYFSKPSTGSYCGANGKNLIITPWGTITSCVEITRKEDPYTDPFIYGRVNTESQEFIFDQEKLDKLRSLHYSYSNKCSRCNLRLICGGGCPVENVWATGFPPKPSKYRCQIEHRLVPELLARLSRSSQYDKIVLDNVTIC